MKLIQYIFTLAASVSISASAVEIRDLRCEYRDATSFQIGDRHSFRAFLGLTPADWVPDGQTIADYREQLVENKTVDRLSDLFLEHLQTRHGLGLGKEVVMIDASFVKVPKQRNNREKNARIKEGGKNAPSQKMGSFENIKRLT